MSAMGEDCTYCNSKSIETLITDQRWSSHDHTSRPKRLVNLREMKKKVKISKERTLKRKCIRWYETKIIKVDEDFDQNNVSHRYKTSGLGTQMEGSRVQHEVWRVGFRSRTKNLKRWSKIHIEAEVKALGLEKQQQVPMVPIEQSDSGRTHYRIFCIPPVYDCAHALKLTSSYLFWPRWVY